MNYKKNISQFNVILYREETLFFTRYFTGDHPV